MDLKTCSLSTFHIRVKHMYDSRELSALLYLSLKVALFVK